ncbi:hypothetical protein BGZ80_002451, partial [Entomortierella chlamydospora]
MVSRAMTKTTLMRSIGLMRPSYAVNMVRTYHRAHEDQSTILPNKVDVHKPEFKEKAARMQALVDDMNAKVAEIKL